MIMRSPVKRKPIGYSQIAVRITPKEKEQIVDICDKENITVSKFLRELIQERIKREQ